MIHERADQLMSIVRLLAFSFRSNLNLLISFPLMTLINSVLLYVYYDLYARSHIDPAWSLVPPTVLLTLVLLTLNYAAIPGIAVRGRAMKIGILSPHRRATLLLTNMLTTITLTSVATYLSVIMLAIINNSFVGALDGVPSNLQPSMSEIVVFWLRYYLAFLGIFVYIALISYTILVWGSRVIGETFNLLVAILVSFFLGFLLQLVIISSYPRTYYLPLYYVYALGIWISGLSGDLRYLPAYPDSDLPGYLPFSIGGAILILFALISLSWISYRRLNLGME